MKIIISIIFLAFAINVNAASPKHKKIIKDVMKKHVKRIMVANGFYPILEDGKIKKLNFRSNKKHPSGYYEDSYQEFGNLMVTKGMFKSGKDKYVLDFVITKVGKEYEVIYPIIWNKNGKKLKYSLKH